MSAPCGLLLAGGQSTRMHADKAALVYDGKSQLERAWALLRPHVREAFVSVRAEQSGEPLRARYPQIVDGAEGRGPVAGLIAAQARCPDAAWLVLACDLPLLDAGTLDELLAGRDRDRVATAFASAHDSLPEPLCAVYEPASRTLLLDYVAAGGHCPRKFLMQHGVRLLAASQPAALDNANTPGEAERARAALPLPESA